MDFYEKRQAEQRMVRALKLKQEIAEYAGDNVTAERMKAKRDEVEAERERQDRALAQTREFKAHKRRERLAMEARAEAEAARVHWFPQA
ncbi:hypothetical protein [Streptomyces albireticuli]|uniref:Uncharacterized protein n=1 Tax=Streptomyces albireticuli TaxID=1940 RepID=A0A2A2CYN1_9ACTN|nr:hypothetical protein [Streptomyces albireticuli]MCD9145920.1 hypothetical protein [Streptomyces albireticuli]MCD9166090.1 hypothetical protein [Streptomyces albireticuli]MCD9196370.1 hypothetical protein [Streptomyces albireticuli]PAU45303.1 hypothetical protein CK936_30280 [Streptomyces albireticuli]